MMAHATGTVSLVCTPSRSVKLNIWQHLAFSYNDILNEVHLFIDGVDQPVIMITPPAGPVAANGNREIVIGNNRNFSQGFLGCIDEVRLWTTIRTPEEISVWMQKNLPDGQTSLAGYWKMNEGRGDSAYDQSGCGHHGPLTGVNWAQGVEMSPSVIIDPLHPDGSRDNRLPGYPNPCNGYLTIGRLQESGTVSLTDMKGTVLGRFYLKKGESIIVDFSRYAKGIYILQSNSDGKWMSGKIIRL
jgi:hypothetical protein